LDVDQVPFEGPRDIANHPRQQSYFELSYHIINDSPDQLDVITVSHEGERQQEARGGQRVGMSECYSTLVTLRTGSSTCADSEEELA
jgi:hypothetical protein